MKVIFFIFLLIAVCNVSFGQTITMNVDNLRNNKGQIIVAVFEDDASFQAEKPKYDKVFDKKSMKNAKLKIRFSLPPGTYAITLVDDENKNNEMDYNFFGIPKEGFGFSNYYHEGMSKPKFQQFKFHVKKGEKKTITSKMRYM
ncbi:MAG: DUF2141 domain-containing protein [Crocinitomicaceae bacterium]|nr:DUF2141 domain-containing protein [Crocinitomicaceae bacterium]